MVEPLTRGAASADVPAATPSAPRLLGPAALVSVAFLGTNALAYVFTVLAARALAPAAFGELAALLGVLLICTVPATGLQTAAALYLGGAGNRTAGGLARLHGAAFVIGLAVVVAGILATAPLTALLHLPDSGAVIGLVALLLPSTLISGYQGMLQGSGQYGRLAAVTGFVGASKLAGGTAGLLIGGTPATALAGMTVGACAGALAGWAGCGRPGLGRGLRAPLSATLHASGALLGFILLLNLDLLLARHHLTAGDAGKYAVGAIIAKMAFWLPQGVGVVLLPRLADDADRRRLLPAALALVGAVGAALTAATAALGSYALPLIGGAAYGDNLGAATWLFAALGTLMALTQLLLFSGIAVADRWAVGAVWAAAAVETAVVELLAARGHLALLPIAVTAVGTAGVLVAVGLVRSKAVRPGPGRPEE